MTHSNKRLIVLAAGQGFKLDGFNKPLLRDPITGERLLSRYLRLFDGWDITVVVGYKAIAIINEYPDLHYVYNDQWSVSGNSYSLSLALDDRPCVVISADLFFDEDLVAAIDKAPENSVFVAQSENKKVRSVRCRQAGGRVAELYVGEPREPEHAETIGIYKIGNREILRKWKRSCATNRSTFAGCNLPLQIVEVAMVERGDLFFHEVNEVLDYLNLIKLRRQAQP